MAPKPIPPPGTPADSTAGGPWWRCHGEADPAWRKMGADIDRRRDDVCMQKIVETAKPVGAGWVADTPGPLSAGGSYLISSGW
jgi:hypothetical protein